MHCFGCCKKLCDDKVDNIMVLENDCLAWIFTERDFMSSVVVRGLDPETAQVSLVMTTSIATFSPETSVRDTAKIMSQNRIRYLPVVQDGKL